MAAPSSDETVTGLEGKILCVEKKSIEDTMLAMESAFNQHPSEGCVLRLSGLKGKEGSERLEMLLNRGACDAVVEVFPTTEHSSVDNLKVRDHTTKVEYRSEAVLFVASISDDDSLDTAVERQALGAHIAHRGQVPTHTLYVPITT